MSTIRAQATPEKKQQDINNAKIRMSTIRAQAIQKEKDIFDSNKCTNKTDP